MEADAEYAFPGEGQRTPSGYGVHGGSMGAAGRVTFKVVGEPSTPPQFGTGRLAPMEIRIESPAGGSWGDPKRRDPELVLLDARNGIISEDIARRIYGVAISPDGRSVDVEATRRAARRMNMPTGRGGRPIIANVDRLNRLMDAAGLAALVVRGGQNVTYLSGVAFHGTLSRHLDLAASRRGVVVIWPRYAPPVFVLEVTAAGAAERDSWIERFDVFSGYVESLFNRVATVLSDLGLAKAPVGFDKNFIGAGFWDDVAKRLPGMTMLDCSDLMDDARLIKTKAEIDLFRDGAALLDAAFAEVLPTIRVGELERQVHGRLIGSCLARGAEFAHGILNSHRNPVIYCGESAFPFAHGDIVRTDYLAYVAGYPGHQSRNAVIGKPSAQQASDYARYYAIYTAAADRLRPGVAVGELYDFVVKQFAKIGWTYEAGLIGHSVGPWWHQQEPIFCRDGQRVLEPGMVVALEPYLAHWHCQDLFLITEDKPELLSPAFETREMFVIEG